MDHAEKKDSDRTLHVNGHEVRRLRLEKCWRVEDLARKAKCSTRTIENAERNAKVYLCTIASIAAALGVERNALIPPPALQAMQAAGQQHSPRRFRMQIVLNFDFEQFDESNELVSFLKLLSSLITSKDGIDVIAVEDGSVILTLEMSERDILALADAIPDLADRAKQMFTNSITGRTFLSDPEWEGDDYDNPVDQAVSDIVNHFIGRQLSLLLSISDIFLPLDSDFGTANLRGKRITPSR